MPKEISMEAALAALDAQPSVSVPVAGRVLGDLGANASYEAAKGGRLGVEVYESGGKKYPRKRVPSIAIKRKLGLGDGPQARESRGGEVNRMR